MLEIRRLSEIAAATSTTSFYANGAWTFQAVDKDGRIQPTMLGCLDAMVSKPLRKAIQSAPWETTLSHVVCRAYAPSYTEYWVNGKREYTARLCGAEHLDAESLAAIKLAESQLATTVKL
jgi:hypothetical protein